MYVPSPLIVGCADGYEVGACAAAGKIPPPGWTKADESGKGVSVSDVSRFGESMLP
jgi:hypothetical protein